jgi:3-oxoacyl-(acyl-carrier-protein) synthase III
MLLEDYAGRDVQIAAPAKARQRSQAERRSEKVFAGASAILGIAHWAPERRVAIEEVEQSITAELEAPLNIKERIGVHEKRICDPSMSITDMAVSAVEKLVRQGTFDGEPLDLQSVDLCIYFAVARECAEPATAVFIQKRLGIDGAMAFDVSDACIGFFDAWQIADSMIAAGRVRRALLVSAERISGISNSAVAQINRGEHPRDHFAALSLGDGAVAVLVGPRLPGQASLRLLAGIRESYAEHVQLCILPALSKPMLTQAGRLFNAALAKFPPLVHAVLERSGWTIDDVDTYITHQASMPSIIKGSKSLGVPFEKTVNTLTHYGNMASVSVPFTLSQMLQERGFQTAQKILMVGFGSGLGVGVLSLTT